MPKLAMPFTVTTRFPLVTSAGTVTVMVLAFHKDAALAAVPLKVTELNPWLAPKPLPLIVNTDPTAPELLER